MTTSVLTLSTVVMVVIKLFISRSKTQLCQEARITSAQFVSFPYIAGGCTLAWPDERPTTSLNIEAINDLKLRPRTMLPPGQHNGTNNRSLGFARNFVQKHVKEFLDPGSLKESNSETKTKTKTKQDRQALLMANCSPRVTAASCTRKKRDLDL